MSARLVRAGFVAVALLAFVLGAPSPAQAQVTVRSVVAATQVPLGETVAWAITVDGISGVAEPDIPGLDWAQVSSRGTNQTMAWVNGRTSARTAFTYAVTPTREGAFALPPVTVRVGNRNYTTDAIPVSVTPSQRGLTPVSPGAAGGGGEHPRLKLTASVAPANVVVGQPVILTMRLAQGVRLLGDPLYAPPTTPGFYAERTGPVRSAYVEDGAGRWLVGETQTVLYPTQAGRLVIGAAHATCLLADIDLPGGLEVELESRPLAVDVLPLPPPPPGYAGAVLAGTLSGAVDRAAVRADETVELTLRLIGTGNLRLAPAPALPELADFQVFDRRVVDSLDVESGAPHGTKIVRYALLPRRTGPLVLPPLRYVTYDPALGYRALEWGGATIDVTAGLARGGAPGGPERAARLVPTAEPGGTPFTAARPFVGAALVALAAALWLGKIRLRSRRSGAEDPAALARHAREAATQLDAHVSTLRAARARGDAVAFWRAAEDALAADTAPAAAALRERVAAARYAPGEGTAAAMDAVEAPLVALLAIARTTASAAGRTRAPRAARMAAWLLVGGAVVLLGLGGLAVASHPPDAELRTDMAEASQALRGGRILEAQRTLVTAWNDGAHRPGVAIDLALAALYQRKLGEAALWTERARRLDPRHPRVLVLAEALAEEGAWEGLPHGARARTTSGELAFASCGLVTIALLVFIAGRRRPWGRWIGRALVVAALGLAIYASQGGAAGEAPGRAVVLATVPLSTAPGAGGDIELEPGRAVWLDGPPHDGWVAVRVGTQVHGFVPQGAVRLL